MNKLKFVMLAMTSGVTIYSLFETFGLAWTLVVLLAAGLAETLPDGRK